MLITIKQLYNERKKLDAPLLGEIEFLVNLPFMAEYILNYNRYDNLFMKKYKSFYPYYNLNDGDKDDVLENWLIDCENLLLIHRAKYEHLIKIDSVVYNPIENYDRYENITFEKQGKENNTMVHGEQRINRQIGESTTSIEYGAITGTEVNKVAPFDSETFNNEGERNSSQNAHSDVTIYDGQTNIDRYETFTDSNTLEFEDRKDLTEAHLHGNIGVTTAQQMMTEDVKFWNSYAFYENMFTDIIMNLCGVEDDC